MKWYVPNHQDNCKRKISGSLAVFFSQNKENKKISVHDDDSGGGGGGGGDDREKLKKEGEKKVASMKKAEVNLADAFCEGAIIMCASK